MASQIIGHTEQPAMKRPLFQQYMYETAFMLQMRSAGMRTTWLHGFLICSGKGRLLEGGTLTRVEGVGWLVEVCDRILLGFAHAWGSLFWLQEKSESQD